MCMPVQTFLEMEEMLKMILPVWTLSPTLSSAIVTNLPFSRESLAVEGKQP